MLDVYFVAGHRQLCTGDSGGPLMWKNPDNGRYIILGKIYFLCYWKGLIVYFLNTSIFSKLLCLRSQIKHEYFSGILAGTVGGWKDCIINKKTAPHEARYFKVISRFFLRGVYITMKLFLVFTVSVCKH